MRILELHHPPTVNADEMTVVRPLAEIRIKETLSLAKIDLAENSRLYQHGQGAVDSRPRGLQVQFPRAIYQLLRRKVLLRLKHRVNNAQPLPGHPEPPVLKMLINLLLNHCLHSLLSIT